MGRPALARANSQAAQEGRALYVRGIPPSWSAVQLQDFFNFQGKVDSVNLLPPRPEQPARAAFVNFSSAEEATNAAQVCDNLPVDDSGGTTFNLVCSIKKDVGKKVDYVSGFTDLSKAQQEKRSVYISGIPPDFVQEEVSELLKPYGNVEEVNMLPSAGKNALSCFAIMSTTEDAESVIEQLNGKEKDGMVLSVSYPRPPKRTRDRDDAGAFLEIRGFPFETSSEDITAAIEAGGHEVLATKVLEHPSSEGGTIARVQLQSAQDAEAVVEELNNFEFMPGFCLQVSVSQEDDEEPGQAAARSRPSKWDVPPRPSGKGGPRCKGGVVGRLAYDRSAYAEADAPGMPEHLATRWPPPLDARPSAAPHLRPSLLGAPRPRPPNPWI